MLFKNLGSYQRKLVALNLSKSGLGTPTLGGLDAYVCTITDNGVGDYTINMPAFAIDTVVALAVPSTASRLCVIGAKDKDSVQILTTDLAGVAAEADFDLQIVGSMARDLLA